MTPKIPDSFKHLPDSALLRARDLADVYGLSVASLHQYVQKEQIPAPCQCMKTLNEGAEKKYNGRKPKMYATNKRMRFWLLGDVRRHVAQINAQKGAA